MRQWILYWREVFRFTWQQFFGIWKAIFISLLCTPIADFIIYYVRDRPTASEWTFSNFMTQTVPLTALALFSTICFLFIVAPYLLYRKQQTKLDTALQQLEAQKSITQPALQIEYDPQRCCEKINVPGLIDPDYSFSVIVSSINTVNPISGVIVGLEELTGADSFGHNNRPFKFKHYQDNHQVTCNRGEKITVHVLLYRGNKKKWQFCFQEGSEGTISLPAAGPYIMRLRATGGGANPDYKKYQIGLRNGVPSMESIS